MTARTQRRRKGFSKSPTEDIIANRLARKYQFFTVSIDGASFAVLAKNTWDAFGLFNLFLRLHIRDNPGYDDGFCAITDITTDVPRVFLMFDGRCGGKAQVRIVQV